MPTKQPISDQSFESIPPQEEKKGKGRFNLKGRLKISKPKLGSRRLPLLIGGLAIFLVFLALLVGFMRQSFQLPKPTGVPSPTPSPGEEITSPSAYATDSAILKIEAELNLIEEKLKGTDLKEAGLNPPVLDLEIEFKE